MSIFDDDIVTRKANPEEYIRELLKEYYKIESPEIEEEKDTYIDNCKGDVTIKPNEKVESLTRDIYRFGSIQGNFDCSGCPNLKSLEGAPQEVKGNFYCIGNESLATLKGAPQKVEGVFDCSGCINLVSLEGAPQEVKGNFYCIGNESLTTLKGAPQKVEGVFDCSGCIKLKSLEGAPKECREIRYPKHLSDKNS